jgi:hypothetical protein
MSYPDSHIKISLKIKEVRSVFNIFFKVSRRKLERPRLRCLEDVENDLREPKMKKWR